MDGADCGLVQLGNMSSLPRNQQLLFGATEQHGYAEECGELCFRSLQASGLYHGKIPLRTHFKLAVHVLYSRAPISGLLV